jgi:hypothetical protein
MKSINNMNKIKISHEVPFCLLEESLKFNDMQYCLPHLMEENEAYRNFFLKCKEDGVEIYLDNSLHELGYALEDEILIKWMNILEPSTFFIPDAWEDAETSIVNAKRWASIEVPANTTKCAVVQATNFKGAIDCAFEYLDLGYEKIAFSYGAAYYNNVCPHPNQDFGKAMGRYMVVKKFQDIMTSRAEFTRIHLLGTSWPAEFGMYKNIPSIESIDTSNPIMAAIGELIYSNMGLTSKPVANMNKYQDVDIDFINVDLVEYNVDMFRKINGL